MWDVKISCEYCPEIMDILKAFFISNDIPYEVRNDNVVFFVDTVNKFFDIVKNHFCTFLFQPSPFGSLKNSKPLQGYCGNGMGNHRVYP